MTSPIQDPSTDRALQGFAYQRDQLLRRPAAPADKDLPVGMATIEGGVSLVPVAIFTKISLTGFDTTHPDVFRLVNGALAIDVPGIYLIQYQLGHTGTGVAGRFQVSGGTEVGTILRIWGDEGGLSSGRMFSADVTAGNYPSNNFPDIFANGCVSLPTTGRLQVLYKWENAAVGSFTGRARVAAVRISSVPM